MMDNDRRILTIKLYNQSYFFYHFLQGVSNLLMKWYNILEIHMLLDSPQFPLWGR